MVTPFFVQLEDLDNLVFSGGGNRCWWQAGLVSTLTTFGWKIPNNIFGCSAGAAVAASLVSRTTEKALQSCKELYGDNPRLLLRNRNKRMPTFSFAQNEIYPQWLRSFLGVNEFLDLTKTNFYVSVSRLNANQGTKSAIFRAVLRHIFKSKSVETEFIKQIPPRLRGFTAVSLELSRCQALPEALLCLEATAAAAPFISGRTINGALYFDGGYISSIPPLPQNASTKLTTMVLLTRHSKNRTQAFSRAGILYIQPSEPIPVSTWGCTADTNVDAAFQLGQRDAKTLAQLL